MLKGTKIIYTLGWFFCLFCHSIYAQNYPISHQEKAENVISNYLESVYKDNDEYRPYIFSNIQVLDSEPYLRLLKLLEAKKYLDGDTTRKDELFALDTLIKAQEKYIEQKNARYNYKISHIYSIKKSRDVYVVYETMFTLSGNFIIKDVTVKMDAELDTEEYDWVYYYMQQYPLMGDNSKKIEESNKIYNYFNQRLSEIEDITDKNYQFKINLLVTMAIKRVSAFDLGFCARAAVRYYMKHLPYDYPDYKSEEFSQLNTLTTGENDSLMGYSLFHQFRAKNSSGIDSLQCFYFELDPWFMVAGMIPVEKPWDNYFQQKK
jgi:hypothetical protein